MRGYRYSYAEYLAYERDSGLEHEREATAPEVPTVKPGKLAAADYDPPRDALPALHFVFDEPVTHGAVLRQLGRPPRGRAM